ncbi:2157_t:CDS:1 [Cetraspora pellucida]|uniref:2157_t:CDS:1 n=1 Tax=Cetraspora pellucida TaxID=1433469 RepID=A0A9N9NTY6_9GLOM|nr:2157_t:CDS:1 [Cetraspora pellucida]
MIHDEKYLTYLPHSGFHNQRIELENGIFLAWFLNRTLIIPPLLMYKGPSLIPKNPFDELYMDLLNHTSFNNNNEAEPYIGYSWEELMNFTFVKQNIKYIYRHNFNFTNLKESLNIDYDNEVYNITNYRQQYFDYLNSTKDLVEPVNLDYLNKISEKLLHFGSLFSSSKIITQLPENRNFRNKLKHMMLPNNPTILNIVDKIVDKIGGTNSYIGVHARIGDLRFLWSENETVKNLIETLQNDYNHTDLKNVSTCLPTKIYLATDGGHNTASLQPFFETFPCVYVRDDFDDLLEPLRSLRNPNDDTIMYEFLKPFVDLLVVSRGNKFYPTYTSTFSRYAKFLNIIWLKNKLSNA